MFGLSLTELLVILAIVLLLFGTRRLRGLGSDLGNAIKGFRQAMRDDQGGSKDDDAEASERRDYIEGEVTRGAGRADASRDAESPERAHTPERDR